jgi:hypothetical protein
MIFNESVCWFPPIRPFRGCGCGPYFPGVPSHLGGIFTSGETRVGLSHYNLCASRPGRRKQVWQSVNNQTVDSVVPVQESVLWRADRRS